MSSLSLFPHTLSPLALSRSSAVARNSHSPSFSRHALTPWQSSHLAEARRKCTSINSTYSQEAISPRDSLSTCGCSLKFIRKRTAATLPSQPSVRSFGRASLLTKRDTTKRLAEGQALRRATFSQDFQSLANGSSHSVVRDARPDPRRKCGAHYFREPFLPPLPAPGERRETFVRQPPRIGDASELISLLGGLPKTTSYRE